MVVVFHWLGLGFAVKWGLLALVPAAIALLIIRIRHGAFDGLRRSAVALLLASTFAGLAPLSLALAPQVRLGAPRLVQPTQNNDAYAHITVAAWLRDHPVTERPRIGRDPPAYGYTRTHLDHGIRVGEQFVQAAAALINRRDAHETWYPVASLWLALLPGACIAAASLVGVSRLAGLMAGLLGGISAVSINLIHNQNSPAVLGVVLAPLVISLIVVSLSSPASEGFPRWLAALGLAGLVGTYAEYWPLVAMIVLLLLALRRPSGYPAATRGAFRILVLSLFLSPLAWFNLGRSLFFEASIPQTGEGPSAFLRIGPLTFLSRLFGVVPLDADNGAVWATLVLTGIVLLGLLFACGLAKERRLWVALIVSSLVLVFYLGSIHRFPYAQQRAVELSLPLLILACAAGWDAALKLPRGGGNSRVRLVQIAMSGAVLVVVGSVFVVLNSRTALKPALATLLPQRTVDSNFTEAMTWVSELADPTGAHLTVISANFFEQTWLTYLLRTRPATDFAFLFSDYNKVSPFLYSDSRRRRFALVGREAYLDADARVVIRRNERFKLLDFERGSALVAQPASGAGFWDAEQSPAGTSYWMQNGGKIAIFRSGKTSRRILISGQANSMLSPLTLTASVFGTPPLGSKVVLADPTTFEITLPDRPRVLLELQNDKRALRPAEQNDRRALSFRLTSIRTAS